MTATVLIRVVPMKMRLLRLGVVLLPVLLVNIGAVRRASLMRTARRRARRATLGMLVPRRVLLTLAGAGRRLLLRSLLVSGGLICSAMCSSLQLRPLNGSALPGRLFQAGGPFGAIKTILSSWQEASVTGGVNEAPVLVSTLAFIPNPLSPDPVKLVLDLRPRLDAWSKLGCNSTYADGGCGSNSGTLLVEWRPWVGRFTIFFFVLGLLRMLRPRLGF